jgi:hypothetical protein
VVDCRADGDRNCDGNAPMSKGQKAPLSPKDISDFVDHRDDLALELYTYRAFLGAGWWAKHGGFYRDPLQDKFRQFDVQGGRDLRKDPARPLLPTTGIRIAAECKNLDPAAPIVVSRVPRAESESYHCLIKKNMDSNRESVVDARVIRSTAVHPKPYPIGEPVGKSILRYQKDPNAKQPEDPYAQWSQALASSATLVTRAYTDAVVNPAAPDLCFIVPALIVANGSLWTVDYDENCARGDPQLVEETSFFLGQDYGASFLNLDGEPRYWISHLHIYTQRGFVKALQTLNNRDDAREWDRVYKCGL